MPYRSCAYPASGISKVASHSLAALLRSAMGGLQPASGGHHRNGKARKKLLVVLLAESLPIGRVEKDPVKLQVVYGLGADAGRASLDLLKYELLKAEQNKFFIEQTHFQQADSLHGSAFAFSHITANTSVQTHEILSLDLVEKISQHNMKRFDNQFYLSKNRNSTFQFLYNILKSFHNWSRSAQIASKSSENRKSL